MKKLSLLLLLCFSAIQPVFAAESITSNIKHALKHSVGSSYFSVVIALGVVILLIYITAIIYAKLNIFGQDTMKKQYIGLSDSKALVLSSTPIGNNKSLLVVELAGKRMLIGVTNESITLIKDLDNNINGTSVPDSLPSEQGVNTLNDKDIVKENKEKEIEIKSNVPDENDDKTKYDSEEFGLYKKYLDD
ncbi:flagellar biosynthetic protein FliO [bacterium]|nr:flagellar biosynthetic protein FliO [bacterium]